MYTHTHICLYTLTHIYIRVHSHTMSAAGGEKCEENDCAFASTKYARACPI